MEENKLSHTKSSFILFMHEISKSPFILFMQEISNARNRDVIEVIISDIEKFLPKKYHVVYDHVVTSDGEKGQYQVVLFFDGGRKHTTYQFEA